MKKNFLWIVLVINWFFFSCATTIAPQKPCTQDTEIVPTVIVPSQLKMISPPKPSKPYQPPVVVASVQLAAMGDVVAHGAVLNSATAANQHAPDGSSLNHGGYDELFAAIGDDLSGVDIGFANLETAIAPKTGKKTQPFFFNAPPDLLSALAHVGINLVSFANNHVFDQGLQGFAETVQQLRDSKVQFVGAGTTCTEANSAKLIEKNGIKLAFLGATTLLNQRPPQKKDRSCVFEFEEKKIFEQLQIARDAGAEIVILSIHWGSEYITTPSQEEIDLAHRLLDGGVDVILGHHPHVLMPVEVVQTSDGRTGLIAYSLGNLISNQSRYYVHGLQPLKMGNTRDGAILRFQVVKKDYGDGIVKTELANLEARVLWTDNNAVQRRESGKIQTVIRVVSNNRELKNARTLLQTELDEKRQLELKKRIELLESRKKIAAEILGEDLVQASSEATTAPNNGPGEENPDSSAALTR